MEITYNQLREKEIVNVTDGRRLGRLCDLVFNCESCKVLGIVAPLERKIFKAKEDIFVPWQNIQKIGADVILIRLDCEKVPQKPKGCFSNEDDGFN